MTEQEAKEKVCCGPLHDNHGPLVKCQGSACMAWRWRFVGEYGVDATNGKMDLRVRRTDDGFCGLAGKP